MTKDENTMPDADEYYTKFLHIKNDFEHLNAHSRAQARELDELKIELSKKSLELVKIKKSVPTDLIHVLGEAFSGMDVFLCNLATDMCMGNEMAAIDWQKVCAEELPCERIKAMESALAQFNAWRAK